MIRVWSHKILGDINCPRVWRQSHPRRSFFQGIYANSESNNRWYANSEFRLDAMKSFCRKFNMDYTTQRMKRICTGGWISRWSLTINHCSFYWNQTQDGNDSWSLVGLVDFVLLPTSPLYSYRWSRYFRGKWTRGMDHRWIYLSTRQCYLVEENIYTADFYVCNRYLICISIISILYADRMLHLFNRFGEGLDGKFCVRHRTIRDTAT